MPYFEAKKAGGSVAFNYKIWLQSAGISATGYANLAAVLADEVALRKLMTIHAAVDYLAGWDSADVDVVDVLNSDLAAKWITLRDYAEDTLTAAYGTLMASIGKYGYGEWCIVDSTTNPVTWGPKGNVPIMTSNTAPYGEAIHNGQYRDNAAAWMVFDNNDSTLYSCLNNQAIADYKIGYHFTNPVCCKKVQIKAFNYVAGDYYKVVVKGSNDGTNWSSALCSAININSNSMLTKEAELDNDNYYLYYALFITESNRTAALVVGSYDFELYGLQFYGRELKVSVPKMTGSNAPYGVAIGTDGYKAFDNNSTTSATGTDIGYQFPNKVLVKKVNNSAGVGTLQCSDNGSAWISDDGNAHKYWRIHHTSSMTMNTLQFYGKNYSEYDWDQDNPQKYLYDHGVEPDGTLTLSGTATKEANAIKLASQNAQASKSLDVSSYSLMRGHAGHIVSSTSQLLCGSGSANFTADYMPYNQGLDISSINGSQTTGVKQTSAGTFECEEIWVE